jgi:hypothetical protein
LSKLTIRTILLLALLVMGSAILVQAQGVSPYFGLGTALDSAGTTTNQYDPNVGENITCPKGRLFDDFSINGPECENGPTMGGVFGVFGVDFMFKQHLGFNGEYSFRFAQAPYLPLGGLNYRPGFYDFNAVWEPTAGADKRIVPEIEGGIGGARIALYEVQSVSVTGITSNFSYPAGINANHFQIHGAVGAKLYVKGNIFVKPQFDIRWVTHLTDQFGRDWVPEITGSVGYTFGQR